MSQAALDGLLQLLDQGRDSAMLRFGIANHYLKLDEPEQAVVHLRQALQLDECYSAAWKLLGQALARCGDAAQALEAYERGIEVAHSKGDKQAAKEMQVFAQRLRAQTKP